MLLEQSPAAAGAEVQVAEPPARGGTGVAARVPLAIDLLMAVGAVVLARGVRRGIDPLIGGVVLFRQRLKQQPQRVHTERRTGDEVALFPGRHPSAVPV